MNTISRRDIWEAYTNSWSEPDAANRKRVFNDYLASDCVYTDPHIQTVGHDGLSSYMSEFQKSVPGGRFVIKDFKEHHDRSLAHWNMVDDKGTVLSQGASFAVYSNDGRLTQMSGFFESRHES